MPGTGDVVERLVEVDVAALVVVGAGADASRRRSAPPTGALLTRLIAPPVEPRPANAEAGPFATSTCSMLNESRE